MFVKGYTWFKFFSPSLEQCIVYETSGIELTETNLHAFQFWLKWKYGIKPNEWHYLYESTTEPLFEEHLQEIIVIEKMFQNRLKIEQSKSSGPKVNPIKEGRNKRGGGFYGKTIRPNPKK